MTWISTKSAITDVLSNNGYREVENLLEHDKAPLSMNHKTYVLKPEGFPVDSLLDNHTIGTYLIRLEVKYKNVNTRERDTNFDLFLALAKEISNGSTFHGYIIDGEFVDGDNYSTIGKLTFYFGVEC